MLSILSMAPPSRTATRSGIPHPLCRRVRGGTIYIAVLGVALVVGVMGAAAIHVARIELHHAVSADELLRSRLAAESGIEYAISAINSNTNWRTEYTSGAAVTLGDARNTLTDTGSFSFTLTDSDGDLADEDQDSVTLRTVGTAGNARSVVEVLLQPSGLGVSSLSSSLHSDGVIRVWSTILTTNQRVSANSGIYTSGASIQGSAASTGNIAASVSGDEFEYVSPAWEMPDPVSAFEYYQDVAEAHGTYLSAASLPGNRIRRVVLSPASNPFGSGATNPQGIYVIDCQGANITLEECRILGTLVLLNAGSGTTISKALMMEPVVANFPALMVQGSVIMDWSYTSQLSESPLGVNLNPVGAPIGGIEDSVIDGSWPGGLKGLVYITGNLFVQSKHAGTQKGVFIVGGTVDLTSQLTIVDDRTFYNNPPPGFATGSKMKIVPGTWKRVAY